MASRLETVPDDVRSLCDLASTDYGDTFESDPAPFDAAAVDPAGWARKVFEGQPAFVRAILRMGWRFPLGLQLAPAGTEGHVIGWRIARSGPGFTVITARSRLLQAEQVFRFEDGRLRQGTFVRYESGLGRRVWPVMSLIHRLVMPRLIDRATKG